MHFCIGLTENVGTVAPPTVDTVPPAGLEWDCRICVAFRILLRDRTQFLRQPFKPDRHTASSPAGVRMFETAAASTRKT